jgi:protein associated with RNAse G/E
MIMRPFEDTSGLFTCPDECNWDFSPGLCLIKFSFIRKKASIQILNTTRMTESIWVPRKELPKFNVVLLKFDGTIRDSYQANLGSRDEKRIVVRARATKKLKVGDFTIEPDDEISQHFFLNEWFYIQQYNSTEGELRGWYCNIGTPPEVKDSTVTTGDLILDVFVDPDRNVKILDEEEFREKQGLMTDLMLDNVWLAKEKILEMVRVGAPPFYPRSVLTQ